jgi:hypothetical protein
VQVPDRSIGQHDPVLQLVFDFVAEYLRQPFQYALTVLRVNQLAGLFEMRRAAELDGAVRGAVRPGCRPLDGSPVSAPPLGPAHTRSSQPWRSGASPC